MPTTKEKIYKALPWVAGVIILALFVKGYIHVFPEVVKHPFFPAAILALAGLALLICTTLGDWPGKFGGVLKLFVEKVGEAGILIALLVILFEFQHFRAFYEHSLKQILTDVSFVSQLSHEHQNDLVRAVVRSRLGDSVPINVVRAFAHNLSEELRADQFVVEEERYLEKEWHDQSKTTMTLKNLLYREIYVYADSTSHVMHDYVQGSGLYSITVNDTTCYEIRGTQPSHIDELVCQVTRVPRNGDAEYVVTIPMTRGEHRVRRRIERVAAPDAGPCPAATAITLDYFTKTFILKYRYSSDFDLSLRGHGDFQALVAALRPDPASHDGASEFTKRFTDSWLEPGSTLVVLLGPPARP